eukprot:3141571-Pyramimonas_sp.AAC.1
MRVEAAEVAGRMRMASARKRFRGVLGASLGHLGGPVAVSGPSWGVGLNLWVRRAPPSGARLGLS